MEKSQVKYFLDKQLDLYYTDAFIPNDPISIPHQFNRKEDIEIAAFLTSIISWGRRDQILKNAKRMMSIMDHEPYTFIMNRDRHNSILDSAFVHRTFNVVDFAYFIKALNLIYTKYGGLERLFTDCISPEDRSLKKAISKFKEVFFSFNAPERSRKHLPDPSKGSAAKRFNMFLRWMVRSDYRHIDFGIWTSISPKMLSCPLDVHSGRVARELGLITRNQNDWKALEELDSWLRKFDPEDPCKYDYALFSLGVNNEL